MILLCIFQHYLHVLAEFSQIIIVGMQNSQLFIKPLAKS